MSSLVDRAQRVAQGARRRPSVVTSGGPSVVTSGGPVTLVRPRDAASPATATRARRRRDAGVARGRVPARGRHRRPVVRTHRRHAGGGEQRPHGDIRCHRGVVAGDPPGAVDDRRHDPRCPSADPDGGHGVGGGPRMRCGGGSGVVAAARTAGDRRRGRGTAGRDGHRPRCRRGCVGGDPVVVAEHARRVRVGAVRASARGVDRRGAARCGRRSVRRFRRGSGMPCGRGCAR